MIVFDVVVGSGYYSEVMVCVVGFKGKVVVFVFVFFM